MLDGEIIGQGSSSLVVVRNESRSSKKVITAFKCFLCEKGNVRKRKLYEKEVQALQRLNHSNIVTYYGCNESNGLLAIEIEYCERGNLQKIIYDQKYVYSITTVLTWAKQLFSALSYLHQERNIVHRDVKPANIFVSKDFHLKLGDFGCVRQLEATSTGTLVGTQRYMSPRMKSKEEPYKVSKRNDVYGAGLVLWEMVERRSVFDEYTLDRNFDANNFYIDIFTKKLTALKPPDCFDELKELIVITTNFDQKQRPSASRVLAQLEEIIEENNDFLEPYAFAPKFIEGLTELLKPISICNHELSKKASLKACRRPSFSSFSNLTLPAFFDQILPDQAKIFSHYSTERDSISQELIATLTSMSSIRDFYRSIPNITNELLNARQFFFHKQNPFALAQNRGSGDVESLFQTLLAEDLNNQKKAYQEAFSLIKKLKGNNISPWILYAEFYANLKLLGEIHSSLYTVTIYFESYYSTRTGYQWLLLNEELGEFARKGLSEVKGFQGEWLKLKEEIRVFKETPSTSTGSSQSKELCHNDFEPFVIEPLDILDLIEIMRRHLKSVARMARAKIQSFIPIETANDLQFDSYIFQLRNPPRRICTCEKSCKELRRIPEEVTTSDGKRVPIPRELGFKIYECFSERYIQDLELYVQFCILLDKVSREKGQFEENFNVESALQPAPTPLMRDCFRFLTCSSLRRDSPNEALILLDFPQNYRLSEGVPALDYKLNFHKIDASTLMKHLDQNPVESVLEIDLSLNYRLIKLSHQEEKKAETIDTEESVETREYKEKQLEASRFSRKLSEIFEFMNEFEIIQ